MIDIKGLDKAEVLKALYDSSHVQGMGFLQTVPEGTVTVQHCRELLKHGTYFDYLYGRILKVDLSGDEFDERLYERDNGRDSAARAISFLKWEVYMDILIGKRQQGKTTRLIELSAAGKGTIVAPTEQSAKYIKEQAKAMKLNIPEPISWNRLTEIGGGGYGGGPYLLDELGGVLGWLNIKTATLGDESCIEYLSGGPLHYGDELTAKIRENTKDLSKLSDFDKFVLNNGYRYETQEALQAGYERHWKAAHDILVSMEEFLAEAEKKQSDPAADVYEILTGLVETKKLRPGEVLNYAHFHWCLDTPEAIVAWQTGRDKWTVNNCSTEITEEAALIKICEEWGFETGRTHIIGTPYYDATDYQFIRFNCAHMAWLWQNGNLLQVYC